MGLIMPEGGGFTAPKQKGIERDSAPEGFEWAGGVLRPIQKQQGLVPISEGDMARITAKRAEMDAEAREAERLPWKDLGIGKSAFMMPNQFDFLDLVFKATAARSGLELPLNGEAIQKFMQGGANAELDLSVVVPFTREDLHRFHKSITSLYRAFSPEFKASGRLQDAFFAGLFFLGKLSTNEKRGYTPEIHEFLLETFPTLNRNQSAYAIAKGMIGMYAKEIDMQQAKQIVTTLHKNNDLFTDIGFLFYEQYPTVFEGLKIPDEKVFSLPLAELVARPEQYASIAFNQLPKIRETEGSKIGYEIETLLQAGRDSIDDSSLLSPLEKLSVVDYETSSMDGGGHVFEFRTPDPGTQWTPNTAQELVELGVLFARSPEIVSVASVHINVDASDNLQGVSPFFFRREFYSHLEMQGIAKPSPRLDTPYINEMSMVIDQTEVLRALYMVDGLVHINAFFAKKFPKEIDLTEALQIDVSKMGFEFLIYLAQELERPDVIPAILRLYSRSALPATNVKREFYSRAIDESLEPITYSPKVKELFAEDLLTKVQQQKITKRLNLTFDEFKDLFHELHFNEHLINNVIHGLKLPIDSDQVLDFISLGSLTSSSVKELAQKVGEFPFSTEVQEFLTNERGGSFRRSMVAKYTQKVPFKMIEHHLRNTKIHPITKEIFTQLISDYDTPEINAYIADETQYDDIRLLVKDASERNRKQALGTTEGV